MVALQRCNYPNWVLNRLKLKSIYKYNTINTNNTFKNNKDTNIYMLVPYTKGVSENFKSICSKHGKQVPFKGDNTIKNLLVAPYIRTPSHRKVV